MSKFLNDASVDGNLSISGNLSTGNVSSTQFGYLSGVTSNIQNQITTLTDNTTGKLLTDMSQVKANTSSAYFAGATALKELANSGSEPNWQLKSGGFTTSSKNVSTFDTVISIEGSGYLSHLTLLQTQISTSSYYYEKIIRFTIDSTINDYYPRYDPSKGMYYTLMGVIQAGEISNKNYKGVAYNYDITNDRISYPKQASITTFYSTYWTGGNEIHYDYISSDSASKIMAAFQFNGLIKFNSGFSIKIAPAYGGSDVINRGYRYSASYYLT